VRLSPSVNDTIRRSEVLNAQLKAALSSRVIIEQAKECSPNTPECLWTMHSTSYAAAHATTAGGWPRWPAELAEQTRGLNEVILANPAPAAEGRTQFRSPCGH
jgi:hypothetical protein